MLSVFKYLSRTVWDGWLWDSWIIGMLIDTVGTHTGCATRCRKARLWAHWQARGTLCMGKPGSEPTGSPREGHYEQKSQALILLAGQGDTMCRKARLWAHWQARGDTMYGKARLWAHWQPKGGTLWTGKPGSDPTGRPAGDTMCRKASLWAHWQTRGTLCIGKPGSEHTVMPGGQYV